MATSTMTPVSSLSSSHNNPVTVTSHSAAQRKKKATRACIHCQKAHLTCDDSRPCQRCIKRDLASTCTNGTRKKAKYLQDVQDPLMSSGASASTSNDQYQYQQDIQFAPQIGLAPTPSALSDMSADNGMTTPIVDPDTFIGNGSGSSLLGLDYGFGSSATTLEYSFLSSMLGNTSFLDPSSSSTTNANSNSSSDNQSNNFANLWSVPVATSHNNNSNATSSINPFGHTLLFDQPQPSPTTTVATTTTTSSAAPPAPSTTSFAETLSNTTTTATPTSNHNASTPATKRRSAQLNTPEAAYARAQKPYSYAEGYHYLINHVRQNMAQEDLMRISRALALFRPSVLASMMNLTEDDLIFTEKCLQRTLLEHEKLISYSGTPTVVWRRTGEIALVGKEFSLLTQWSRDALLSKKTYIFELMSNSSAVEYWEKYALHAFDNTDSAVYSSCILLSPTKRPVPCTFCFTIKRDIFDLPSVIVGNFLPILS